MGKRREGDLELIEGGAHDCRGGR
jgi:hypothetical protein